MTPNFDARKLSGGNLALPSMAGPLRRDENMRFETSGGGGLARYGRTVNQNNIQIKGIPSPAMNKPITVNKNGGLLGATPSRNPMNALGPGRISALSMENRRSSSV